MAKLEETEVNQRKYFSEISEDSAKQLYELYKVDFEIYIHQKILVWT